MKRVLILAFFIIFTQNAFALDCELTDNGCPAGCGYDKDLNECAECTVGTYSAGGYDACADCYRPNEGADWTGEEPGMVNEYSCPWTLTCSANAYFDKESGQCTSCGDNYTSIYHDKGGFTMEFRGTGQEEFNRLAEQYSHDIVCEPNVKQIQLSPGTQFNTDDNNLWPGTTEVYYTKGVYYKYDTGFRLDDSAIGSWNPILPDKALQPTDHLKQFFGYAENANMCSDGKLVFDSNGNFTSDDYDLSNVPLSLVACWENKAIGINYFMNKKSGDEVVEVALKRQCMVNDDAGQLEYYEDGKLTGQKCVAMEYDTSKYYVEPGKVFSHYELRCQSPGTGFEPCGDVTVPNKIPVPVSTVILSPVFSDCPAGYYCNAGVKTACPMGTTSDAGATSIDDCEMRGGPNGVKFCDSIGCFHLPAGTVIKPYQP